MDTHVPLRRALIVVDLQRGFEEPSYGRRDNPDCEANIRRLVEAFRADGSPIVLVRHDSVEPDSPLRPDLPGNAFKAELEDVEPALLVSKRVHSAFHGDVDLHQWLQSRGVEQLVVCGIQTNFCCETTTRVGGDLGYDMLFALDATHTFDQPAADGGEPLSAELVSRVTAANLDGEFARVRTTEEIVTDMVAGAAATGTGRLSLTMG